jgi:serine/threonine protein phosphatase PrpC
VQHLLHATELTSTIVLLDEKDAVEQLRAAVTEAHQKLVAKGQLDGRRPATTLTMFAGFWPRVFIVNAGDSRYYRLRNNRLERFTKDQTMAEMMVEQGALTREKAEASRLKHVLWSAIGNEEMKPDVQAIDIVKSDRHLLCTDGLTKHVSDDEIKERMLRDESAEATVRGLIDLALERGGTDNVTVVVCRITDAPLSLAK